MCARHAGINNKKGIRQVCKQAGGKGKGQGQSWGRQSKGQRVCGRQGAKQQTNCRGKGTKTEDIESSYRGEFLVLSLSFLLFHAHHIEIYKSIYLERDRHRRFRHISSLMSCSSSNFGKIKLSPFHLMSPAEF